MKRTRRSGFSLLEMLLATAVLLGCVIVLAELAGIGNHHLDDIEGLSTAQLICQSALNEMLSGAAPVQSFEDRPVDEHPGWMVSAEVASLRQQRVASLRVTAWYEDPEPAGDEFEPRRRFPFTLVRWTRDPHSPSPADAESGARPFSLMDQIGGGGSP